MAEVWSAIFGLPTVFYTFLLGLVLAYWVLVLLGGTDPDSMDSVLHTDVHGGADAWLTAALNFLNIGSAPVTVVFSAIVFLSWVNSLMLQLYVAPAAGGLLPLLLVQIGVGLSALAGGLVLAGFSTRPLRGLFKVHTVRGGDTLLDQVCTVTSSSVTADFGQAEFARRGSPLLLSVYCRRPNKLAKGSSAVIVSYDPKNDAYEIGELEPGISAVEFGLEGSAPVQKPSGTRDNQAAR